MIKEFEEGKKYVFCKEALEEDIKNEMERTNVEVDIAQIKWPLVAEGKTVEVQNKHIGHIEDFVIFPEWCITKE